MRSHPKLKMNRIISICFFTCLFASIIEARTHFSFELNASKNDLGKNQTETKINYRLPKTATPISYKIELTPYFNDESEEKKFTFDGRVEISLVVSQPVNNITFHSVNLSHTKTELYNKLKNNTEVKVEFDIDYSDKSVDFTRLMSKPATNKFKEGNYVLKMQYKGKLEQKYFRGFYRNSYINDNNETVWFAATHFEPTAARRAFPCFDEPEYKATFDVSITHNKNYSALFNTKFIKISNPNEKGEITTTFQTTPKMSTYLLAFVVSDFSNSTNDAKNFTVYARPNAIKHSELALKTGEKLLKALEDYTGIKFAEMNLGKMDQVAVPDFIAGAMENWGLVLYSEKSLLYDEKVSTTAAKQNIIQTIAHEFAHQWFGDFVSPKWWKYLWLNEGFATFFQYYISDKVESKQRAVDQSVVKSLQSNAFIFDSDVNTHPINHDVESPKEISSIFDAISYQKAGFVIRMMQHFLNETIFKEGLQKYLQEHKNGIANSDDLFKSIQNIVDKYAVKINVTEIMDSWINNKGYPVVNVKRNYDNKIVEITQSRFVTYEPSKEEAAEKHLWTIPINYATEVNPNFEKTTPDCWLKSNATNLPIKVEPKNWIILNKQQTGFYRVNYDDKNWELIVKYLNSNNRSKIHVLNRAQLMDDALAFAQQKQLNILTPLRLTAHLSDETDYIAWYSGFKIFKWFNDKLINTEYYPTFKQYVFKVTKNVINSVGFEEVKDEIDLSKMLRIKTSDWACSMGNRTCEIKMYKNLTNWLKDPVKYSISSDLKDITLCHGLRIATSEDWEKAFEKTIATTDDNEKSQLSSALGCSKNKTILQYYLNYTLIDNSKIDMVKAINSIRVNGEKKGVDTVLEFLINRFTAVVQVVKVEIVADLFANLSGTIKTKEQLQLFNKTRDLDISSSLIKERIYKATIEASKAVESNVKWLKENKDHLTRWVNEVTDHPKTNGVGIYSGSIGLISSVFIIIFTITK